MASLKYLGGLPEGKYGQDVDVDVRKDALAVRHAPHSMLLSGPLALVGRWDASVPLADITDLQLGQAGSHMDALHGLLNKKKDYALTVSFATAGLSTALVIGSSKPKDLERLRQDIAKARAKIAHAKAR
jgi:hypothetical protein